MMIIFLIVHVSLQLAREVNTRTRRKRPSRGTVSRAWYFVDNMPRLPRATAGGRIRELSPTRIIRRHAIASGLLEYTRAAARDVYLRRIDI